MPTCHTATLTSAGTCAAHCEVTAITTPKNGDGCCPTGADSTNDDDCVPQVGVSVEPSHFDTELGKTLDLTVTVTGSGGFSGDVALAGALSADGGAAAPNLWAFGIDAGTLTLGANGTATAHGVIKIPTRNTALGVIATVTASSATAASASATSSVTLLNQFTIEVPISSGGGCIYPPAGTTELTLGSKLRWKNAADPDGGTRITIHTQGSNGTCQHQQDPGMAPGGFYECVMSIASGSPFSWDCHAPGPGASGLNILPVLP